MKHHSIQVHEIEEIRVRSIDSINLKLKSRSIRPVDLDDCLNEIHSSISTKYSFNLQAKAINLLHSIIIPSDSKVEIQFMKKLKEYLNLTTDTLLKKKIHEIIENSIDSESNSNNMKDFDNKEILLTKLDAKNGNMILVADYNRRNDQQIKNRDSFIMTKDQETDDSVNTNPYSIKELNHGLSRLTSHQDFIEMINFLDDFHEKFDGIDLWQSLENHNFAKFFHCSPGNTQDFEFFIRLLRVMSYITQSLTSIPFVSTLLQSIQKATALFLIHFMCIEEEMNCHQIEVVQFLNNMLPLFDRPSSDMVESIHTQAIILFMDTFFKEYTQDSAACLYFEICITLFITCTKMQTLKLEKDIHQSHVEVIMMLFNRYTINNNENNNYMNNNNNNENNNNMDNNNNSNNENKINNEYGYFDVPPDAIILSSLYLLQSSLLLVGEIDSDYVDLNWSEFLTHKNKNVINESLCCIVIFLSNEKTLDQVIQKIPSLDNFLKEMLSNNEFNFGHVVLQAIIYVAQSKDSPSNHLIQGRFVAYFNRHFKIESSVTNSIVMLDALQIIIKESPDDFQAYFNHQILIKTMIVICEKYDFCLNEATQMHLAFFTILLSTFLLLENDGSFFFSDEFIHAIENIVVIWDRVKEDQQSQSALIHLGFQLLRVYCFIIDYDNEYNMRHSIAESLFTIAALVYKEVSYRNEVEEFIHLFQGSNPGVLESFLIGKEDLIKNIFHSYILSHTSTLKLLPLLLMHYNTVKRVCIEGKKLFIDAYNPKYVTQDGLLAHISNLLLEKQNINVALNLLTCLTYSSIYKKQIIESGILEQVYNTVILQNSSDPNTELDTLIFLNNVFSNSTDAVEVFWRLIRRSNETMKFILEWLLNCVYTRSPTNTSSELSCVILSVLLTSNDGKHYFWTHTIPETLFRRYKKYLKSRQPMKASLMIHIFGSLVTKKFSQIQALKIHDFFLDIFAGFMLECKELDESLLVLLCHFCVFKDHRSLLMNNVIFIELLFSEKNQESIKSIELILTIIWVLIHDNEKNKSIIRRAGLHLFLTQIGDKYSIDQFESNTSILCLKYLRLEIES